MQGILIDPKAKTVTTCEVDDINSLQSLRNLMRCAYVEQVRLGEPDVLLVDEEGRLTYPNKDGYFIFQENMDTLLAGCAVVLSIGKDGTWGATTRSVEDIQSQVTWVTPSKKMAKVRSFVFSW